MKKIFLICICFCAIVIAGAQNVAAQQNEAQQQQSATAQQSEVQQVTQAQLQDLSNLSPDGEEMYQKALQALKAAVSDEDYANALAFVKKILVFDPNRADVCYKIGEMAMLIEDITGILAYRNEAMRYFDKAVQIDPSYSDEVDKQYNLMTFEGELMPSVPIPETNRNVETASNQTDNNDLIFLYDNKMSSQDLKKLKENQPFLYNKYFRNQAKYKRLRTAGWITFGVGLGVGTLAFSLIDETEGFAVLGAMGFVGGLYAGIPLIIVGYVKGNRNDRNIVKEYNTIISRGEYRTAATFSLGSTRNGLGFLVKF